MQRYESYKSSGVEIIGETLGRLPTFFVLTALLWSSLPSIFYVSMFVTGETL